MAKEYAYYIEGNKVAIVERDTAFDNNVNSKEYGPGVSRTMWKSPKTSVTDGLEIKYAYSPTYRVSKAKNQMDTMYYTQGWTVIDGYLTFVRGTPAAAQNWNVATSGSEGDTGGQSLDYILVSQSSRWNGVHQVQDVSVNGLLKTYTKVNNIFPYVQNVDLDANTQSIFDGGGSDDILIADLGFAVGDYVFLAGFTTSGANAGVYLINSLTLSTTDTDSKLNFSKRYSLPNNNTLTPNVEIETTAAFVTHSGTTNNTVAKIEHEISLVTTNINVLNDEADTIDIPSYLSKALVYYVKARLAEDSGQIELKEYNMREYKKHIEQYESSLMKGPRIMSSGPYAIR